MVKYNTSVHKKKKKNKTGKRLYCKIRHDLTLVTKHVLQKIY